MFPLGIPFIFCKYLALTYIPCMLHHFITQGQQSIVQRFDALDVNLQLLLKVAAVFTVGNKFTKNAIQEVISADTNSNSIEEELTELENLGFIQRIVESRDDNKDSAFVFTHSSVKEV